MKQLAIRIPDDLHSGIKTRAAMTGSTVQEICTKLLTDYLESEQERQDALEAMWKEAQHDEDDED